MSTVVCDAWIPLRIRVRKSAMGSVIDMWLPARLRHAGDVAVVREVAQADPAQAELAVHAARAPALATPGVLTGLVLAAARLAHALGGLRHLAVLGRVGVFGIGPTHPGLFRGLGAAGGLRVGLDLGRMAR